MTFGKKVPKKPSVSPKVISMLNLNKKLNFCKKNISKIFPGWMVNKRFKNALWQYDHMDEILRLKFLWEIEDIIRVCL